MQAMMMVSLSANHAMESRVLTPQHILKVGHAFRGAKTLLSAVELHVFTALADGPAGPETLSSRTGVHQRGARDFFDALVALGMLERDERGLYANTPETAFYLDRNKRDFYAVGVEVKRRHRPSSGAHVNSGMPYCRFLSGPIVQPRS